MSYLFCAIRSCRRETVVKEGMERRVGCVQDVEYLVRGCVGVCGMRVVSVVWIWFDGVGRVVRVEERWLGVPLIDSDWFGGFGWVVWKGRGYVGKVVEWGVRRFLQGDAG